MALTAKQLFLEKFIRPLRPEVNITRRKEKVEAELARLPDGYPSKTGLQAELQKADRYADRAQAYHALKQVKLDARRAADVYSNTVTRTSVETKVGEFEKSVREFGPRMVGLPGVKETISLQINQYKGKPQPGSIEALRKEEAEAAQRIDKHFQSWQSVIDAYKKMKLEETCNALLFDIGVLKAQPGQGQVSATLYSRTTKARGQYTGQITFRLAVDGESELVKARQEFKDAQRVRRAGNPSVIEACSKLTSALDVIAREKATVRLSKGTVPSRVEEINKLVNECKTDDALWRLRTLKDDILLGEQAVELVEQVGGIEKHAKEKSRAVPEEQIAKARDRAEVALGNPNDRNVPVAKKNVARLQERVAQAADPDRLRAVLDRLDKENKQSKLIGANVIVTATQSMETHLANRDLPAAQRSLRRLMDSILAAEANQSPEERTKLARQREEEKIAKRQRRAQELAKASDDPEVKALSEMLSKLVPPFDQAKAARAAQLYAELLLRSSGASLEEVGGSANIVLVLKAHGGSDEEDLKSKSFFKPARGEEKQPGWEQGSGALREVVGKAVSDALWQTTGLQANVPETHLVALSRSVLPEDLKKKGLALGSLQHNVHRKGDAEQVPLGQVDKHVLRQIPKKKAQALQVFDLVFANLDRHAGNVFLKGDGAEAELSPIDNGMGAPSKLGLLVRAEGFASHALKDLPANDEKLDADVQAAIGKLEAQTIGNAARAAIWSARERFPGESATDQKNFNEEHVTLMEASVRFLKQAAKDLTVNELFNAYLVNLQEIYGIGNLAPEGGNKEEEGAEEQRFKRVIAETKARGSALKTLVKEEGAIKQALKENGWPDEFPIAPGNTRGVFVWRTWSRFYPRQLVAIYEKNKLGMAVRGPLPIKVPPVGNKALADFTRSQKEQYQKEFETTANPSGEDMNNWEAYQSLGGLHAFQKYGGAASANLSETSVEGRYKRLYQLKTLHDALMNVDVAGV